MKTRVLCALLLVVILVAACASAPAAGEAARKGDRLPPPAGHYSLFYRPKPREESVIPVTEVAIATRSFLRACSIDVYNILPRFGRSIFYRCH